MSNLKTILVFVIAACLFFIAVAITFKDAAFSELIQQITLTDLLENTILGFLYFVSFGSIMLVGFRTQYNLKLSGTDILTLPLMMHLFLYIMPIKGGLLFKVFFVKSKYKLDMSKGFSLGIMVFLSSLVLTVLFGLVLVYFIPINSIALQVALWFMGLSLIGFPIILGFLPSVVPANKKLLSRLIGFLINVKIQLSEQIRNKKLFYSLGATTLFSAIVQTLWFWHTAHILEISTQFLSIFLVVLILRIALLFRLLPGNLGIQELMIGVVFTAAGFSMEQGLMIGLITRMVSVFLATTIGLGSLYSNLKYFETNTLFGLIKKVAKKE